MRCECSSMYPTNAGNFTNTPRRLQLLTSCSALLTSLDNSGLYWTIFARNRDTVVPAEENGDLQTLICVLAARVRRCHTLSNPVLWQSWMAAYPGYTLLMKMLFPGRPIMVHESWHAHKKNKKCHFQCWDIHMWSRTGSGPWSKFITLTECSSQQMSEWAEFNVRLTMKLSLWSPHRQSTALVLGTNSHNQEKKKITKTKNWPSQEKTQKSKLSLKLNQKANVQCLHSTMRTFRMSVHMTRHNCGTRYIRPTKHFWWSCLLSPDDYHCSSVVYWMNHQDSYE